MSEKLMITLATCCRNRVEHLKKTLPENMKNNTQDYVRYLLVNYNSQDDLDDWVRSELAEHIQSGRLLYVYEKTATRFLHAHARNVAVRACQSDIFCNVDADNFMPINFGAWLRDVYMKPHAKPVFTGYGGPTARGSACGGLFGRVSFRLNELIALGGYNEDLNQWGIEDYDITVRAYQAGYHCQAYPLHFDDVKPLEHPAASRVVDTEFSSPLKSLKHSEELHLAKFGMGQAPNAKGRWGKATVEVNWERTVELPLSAGEVLP